MNNLIVTETKISPKVVFKLNGELSIVGKSYPVDVTGFFTPLVELVSRLMIDEIRLDIKLEYINIGSLRCILQILNAIEQNDNIVFAHINWYIHDEDCFIMDNGRMLNELTQKCQFQFHAVDNLHLA